MSTFRRLTVCRGLVDLCTRLYWKHKYIKYRYYILNKYRFCPTVAVLLFTIPHPWCVHHSHIHSYSHETSRLSRCFLQGILQVQHVASTGTRFGQARGKEGSILHAESSTKVTTSARERMTNSPRDTQTNLYKSHLQHCQVLVAQPRPDTGPRLFVCGQSSCPMLVQYYVVHKT